MTPDLAHSHQPVQCGAGEQDGPFELADPSRRTTAEHDASNVAAADASARAGCDASRFAGGTPRICAWCTRPIPAPARRDAICCSTRCRQARHRFGRTVGHVRNVATGRPLRLAYADPPYPGKAWLYKEHPDYAGEVDHAELIRRLQAYDGWALSTSAAALPAVLALCPPIVRVGAWHRGERPAASWWPQHAWEPVIYHGGRPVDPSHLQTRRIDSLVHGISAMTTLPGRVVGTKPAAFCRWIFDLLGAQPHDTLDDLYPGSGAVTRAWAAFTEPSPEFLPDASRQARADASYPTSHATANRTGPSPPGPRNASSYPPADATGSNRGSAVMTAVLDWSGRDGAPLATVGPPAPCQHCGKAALLRHPATGRPCHKVCAEQALDPKPASTLDSSSPEGQHTQGPRK